MKLFCRQWPDSPLASLLPFVQRHTQHLHANQVIMDQTRNVYPWISVSQSVSTCTPLFEQAEHRQR